MTTRRRTYGRAASSALWSCGIAFLISGCSENPVDPRLAPVEVVVAEGDGQYGTVGTELGEPLRVVVREAASKLPVSEVSVQWTVTSGDASLSGPDVRVTDEAGIAETTLRLGPAEGRVTVSATVADQPDAHVTLQAFVVGIPRITAVDPAEVEAGGTVVLEGENFSPTPEQNLVLFEGLRGRVETATPTRMEVEVPDCIPSRSTVEVRAGLGSVMSEAVPLSVSGTGGSLPLDVGDVVDLDDPDGLDCVRLSGADSAAYVAVATSASTIAGATHPFRMTGLASGGGRTTAGRARDVLSGAPPRGDAPEELSAQERFESSLRLEEAELVERRVSGAHPTPEALRAPAAAPSTGQHRDFFVFNGGDDAADRFDQVRATVRHVSRHAVIYVDDEAPEGGFTDADLDSIGERFDEVIHPTVTDVFGAPSDLDGNERVAMLFTPVVNELTERESDSFVGGFFYGRDLMPELASSNGGEIFYALVPDPNGEHGDPRQLSQVRSVVPSILAHEFQHMVHFNQRVLLRDASQDALWMLEGLAQMAEELVARAYERRSAPSDAELFRDGNRRRARLYLDRPDSVSLIVSSGRGTLAERGAGFLFLLYLHQQHEGDLLSRLTRTRRTGVENVEAETGRQWGDLVPEWSAAAFLDREGVGRETLRYRDYDLAGFLGDPFPLFWETGGDRDFSRSSRLPSSASRYFVLVPGETAILSVGFAGAGGGRHALSARTGLRIVRIR
ncbi:MAG: hypothetical protein U5R14_04725 [Gemmatimonadota bacterium]|nr:hypothetical protein [Gemmatimonadota bacterium]